MVSLVRITCFFRAVLFPLPGCHGCFPVASGLSLRALAEVWRGLWASWNS